MIAALLLAATTAAAAPSVAAGRLNAVVVRNDSTVLDAVLPLTAEQLKDAREVWTWSEELPPLRLSPTAIGKPEEVREQLRRAVRGRQRLEITPHRKKEEIIGLLAIVAPEPMWIAVPESLLPRYRVGEDGSVSVPFSDRHLRVRFAGKRLGSTWMDVDASSRSRAVSVRDAADVELAIVSGSRRSPSGAYAVVLRQRTGPSQAPVAAQFVPDDRIVIRIAAVPSEEAVRLGVFTDDFAPAAVTCWPGRPATVHLVHGQSIHGRFVDREGKPLQGVAVIAQGWMGSDAPALVGRSATSDSAGVWTLDHLPHLKIALRASRKGWSSVGREITLSDEDVDLGPIVLEKAAPVRLVVRDQDRQPVAGARVSVDGVPAGVTAGDGGLVIEGLGTSKAAEIAVSGAGFEPASARLQPPFRKSEEISVERAITVTGRIVDETGVAVENASVRIESGTRFHTEAIGGDGTFEISLPPNVESSLTFESPASLTVTRTERAGRPGERRDSGTITLPRGHAVRGRLTTSTGEPLVGGRVWALRASANGPLVAWAMNRVAETRSNADGSFELRGLSGGPSLLRIDAAGFARVYRDVNVADTAVDLGDIDVPSGSTVRVNLSDDSSDGTARVDLRGDSLDVDMITAAVGGGRALIAHVPPGSFTVSVVRGPGVICEAKVVVPADGKETAVDCGAGTIVRGTVLVGGSPAPAGTLSWTRGDQAAVQSVILNTLSPLGARRQDVYGLGSGTVVATVEDDGRFEARDVTAGNWQVVWISTDNAASAARPVAVPDVREMNITLEYDGSVVRGQVIEEDGQPVGGARVVETGGHYVTMSRPDGEFAFIGMPPGAHQIQASLGDRASELQSITVAADRPAPDITLRLRKSDRDVLTVAVVGLRGEPVPNGFVFIEASGVSRIATTDASGMARTSFPGGIPEQGRLAAFAQNVWVFAEMRCTAGQRCQATLRGEETGALRIDADAGGVPQIVSPVAGNLSWMMARLGMQPVHTPGAPTVIAGLPPGSYQVSLGAAVRTVVVTAGETTAVDLR